MMIMVSILVQLMRMETATALESVYTIMALNMSVNGKITNAMVKERLLQLMELIMRVSGSMT